MNSTSLAPSWDAVLTRHGLRALPHSRFVPLDVWLADGHAPATLLHLEARGTRVRVTAYDRSDLATLLLRAECDCEEHRMAGAVGRPVLRPGARPLAAAVHDGAEQSGWTGVEAGLLRRDGVAPLLDPLLDRLLPDVRDRLAPHRGALSAAG